MAKKIVYENGVRVLRDVPDEEVREEKREERREERREARREERREERRHDEDNFLNRIIRRDIPKEEPKRESHFHREEPRHESHFHHEEPRHESHFHHEEPRHESHFHHEEEKRENRFIRDKAHKPHNPAPCAVLNPVINEKREYEKIRDILRYKNSSSRISKADEDYLELAFGKKLNDQEVFALYNWIEDELKYF